MYRGRDQAVPRVSKLLWAGLGMVVFGSAPLLLIVLAANLGLTHDPDPNPVGPGLLAGVTFMPGLAIAFIGFCRSLGR